MEEGRFLTTSSGNWRYIHGWRAVGHVHGTFEGSDIGRYAAGYTVVKRGQRSLHIRMWTGTTIRSQENEEPRGRSLAARTVVEAIRLRAEIEEAVFGVEMPTVI